MMFNGKKGFIPIAITAGLLLALAVVFLVLFGGIGFVLWVLKHSMFSIIGAVLLIFFGLALLKGIRVPLPILYVGVGLVVLPMVLGGLKTITGLSIANNFLASGADKCVYERDIKTIGFMEKVEADMGGACFVKPYHKWCGNNWYYTEDNKRIYDHYGIVCRNNFEDTDTKLISYLTCTSDADCRKVEGREVTPDTSDEWSVNFASSMDCVQGFCRNYLKNPVVEKTGDVVDINGDSLDDVTGRIIVDVNNDRVDDLSGKSIVSETNWFKKLINLIKNFFARFTLW